MDSVELEIDLEKKVSKTDAESERIPGHWECYGSFLVMLLKLSPKKQIPVPLLFNLFISLIY